jgi:hypothetical protein
MALTEYTNADFAAQQSDIKSVIAATVHLNGLLIHWYCSKQSSVPLSTMKSELKAFARGVQEVLGYHELQQEIGYISTQPMPLYMDNQVAITQITPEASSQRSKYIDIKYNFLKDLYDKERIIPTHVPTKSMLADLMTKAFPTPEFRRLCRMIGLKDVNKMMLILDLAKCWNSGYSL